MNILCKVTVLFLLLNVSNTSTEGITNNESDNGKGVDQYLNTNDAGRAFNEFKDNSLSHNDNTTSTTTKEKDTTTSTATKTTPTTTQTTPKKTSATTTKKKEPTTTHTTSKKTTATTTQTTETKTTPTTTKTTTSKTTPTTTKTTPKKTTPTTETTNLLGLVAFNSPCTSTSANDKILLSPGIMISTLSPLTFGTSIEVSNSGVVSDL